MVWNISMQNEPEGDEKPTIAELRRAIIDALKSYKFSFDSETELQLSIMEVLDYEGIQCSKEYKLGEKGRIDFFCDGIGIEIKTKGGFSKVLRQIADYVEHNDIAEIILVTTKSSHRKMPISLNNKIITVLYIGGVF